MENTSVSFPINELSESQEDDVMETSLFDRSMGVWIPGILCITGFLGNVVSLLVLSLDRTKDPTFYSLRALALSDVILLITAFLQQVSNIILFKYNHESKLLSENRCGCCSFSEQILNLKCKMLDCQFLYPC